VAAVAKAQEAQAFNFFTVIAVDDMQCIHNVYHYA